MFKNLNLSHSLKISNFKFQILRRFGKRLLALLLTFTIVLTGTGVYFLFFASKSASAAWYDDSWTYRQRVDITNGGTAQTDYQVSITLDTATLITAGKVQSDCDDLRITDTNGKLLPHWIEESNPGCNSATTKIWTKAPSITTSGATVYLYYGNPSATNVENPTQVFVFYDNFSGNLSRWTIPSGCTSAISSGVLQITANTTCDSTPMYVTNLTQSDASGYAFDFRGKFSSGGSGRLQMYQRYRSTNSYLSRFWISGTVTNFQENAGSWSSNIDIGSTGTSADTWYNFGIKVTGTSNQLYVNGTSIGTGTTLPADLISETDLTVGLGQYNTTVQYDNIRVRKSASTEPSIASPTNEEKATSPVAYWKFDDGTGTNAQDSSPNNLDGTISGATWQTEDQCISGKCLYFDGTDDYVEVADNAVNDLGTTWTAQFWIKPIYKTTANDYGVILSKGTAADASTDGIRFDNTDNIYVTEGGTDDLSFDISTDSPGGTWTHVALVANSSQTTLYVNGAQKTTGTTVSSSFMNKSAVMRIGDPSYDFWGSGPVPFKGYLDELKLYNFALTVAQVKANYSAKASGDGASAVFGSNPNQNLSNGLVGYWKMDETATPAVDSSGNSNSGTWTGNATNAAGKFGNAISLDGTGDYISVADGGTSSLDVTTAVSEFAWVYMTTAGDVIGKPSNYKLAVRTSDKLQVAIATANNSWDWVSVGNTAVTTSAWHHIGFTYSTSDNTIRYYLDGALDGTITTVSGAITTDNSAAQIGYGGSVAFTGKIDEARVYNRTLSPDEVSQLYNFAPGPVGYWNFNEGSGTAASDISGNANTGTWQGTTTSVWAPGKYGKSGSFNGSDNYVSLTDGTNMSPGAGNFTVSAWVKTDVVNGADHWIWVNYGSATNNLVLLRLQSTNSFQAVFRDAEADTGLANTTTTLAINTWYYVTAVRDGTIVYIYLNGIPEASSTTAALGTITSSDGTAPVVGRNELTPGTYFDGNIDEVKIYNYARNSKQIVEDMNGGHPSVGSPVGSAVGYWRFDEGSDNTCSVATNDVCNSGSQGSTLDGAESGMATPATSASGWTQAGKFGKALTFDGSDDYVGVTNATAMQPLTGDWSVGFWMYRLGAGASDFPQIIGSRPWTAAADKGWAVTWDSGNNKICSHFADGTAGFDVNSGNTCSSSTSTLNTWEHWTAVFDRTNSKLYYYKNGVLDGSLSPTGGFPTASINQTNNIYIGREIEGGNTRKLNARLDEMKVYNFALTAAEVKLDMNRGQAQLLGATSDNTSYALNAANQEYCVPGDSTSCVAPIARWDFNEGGSSTTTADTSGSGNTGTITVGASGSQTTASQLWKPGKAGKALNLDGTDDYVTLGSALNVANTMTITGWFFTNDITKRQTLLALHSGGANTGNIEVGTPYPGTSTASVGMVKYGVDTAAITPAGLYSNGTWVHFAYTRSGAYTTQQFYINGVAVTTTTTNNDFSDDAGVGQIGVRTSGSQFFTGSVDNLRVYNYARTAAQIAWDYNRGRPVGWWRFDECQGTTANDSSGNSNTGTITIGATGTYTSAGTCPSGTATHAWAGGVAGAGKRNYALSFDGTDDQVSVASPTKIPSGASAFTSSVWIKPSSTADNKYITMWGVSGVSGTMNALIWYGATSSVAQAFYGNDLQTATNSVPVSTWTHLVATYDGTTRKIYLNGALSTSDTPTAPNVTANQTLYIGSVGGSAYFPGQIDDARVYSYALTSLQVKSLYNDGFVYRVGPNTGAP